MSDEAQKGFIYHGSHTKEDPFRYEVNEALCRAVIEGRWDVTMLKNLAEWALRRMEADTGEAQGVEGGDVSDETLVGRVATTLEEEMEPYIGPPSSYTVTARAILLEVAASILNEFPPAGSTGPYPQCADDVSCWLREQAAEGGER